MKSRVRELSTAAIRSKIDMQKTSQASYARSRADLIASRLYLAECEKALIANQFARAMGFYNQIVTILGHDEMTLILLSVKVYHVIHEKIVSIIPDTDQDNVKAKREYLFAIQLLQDKKILDAPLTTYAEGARLDEFFREMSAKITDSKSDAKIDDKAYDTSTVKFNSFKKRLVDLSKNYKSTTRIDNEIIKLLDAFKYDSKKDTQYSDMYLTGRQALRDGQLQTAYHALSKVTQRSNQPPEAWIAYADTLMQLDSKDNSTRDSAIAAMEKAFEYKDIDRCATVFSAKARITHYFDGFEKAIQWYISAILLAIDSKELYQIYYTQILDKHGKQNIDTNYFRKYTITIENYLTRNKRNYYCLPASFELKDEKKGIASIVEGVIALVVRNFSIAHAFFTRAIELLNEDPFAYVMRGIVNDLKQDSHTALADFNKAIEKSMTFHVKAHYLRANLFVRLGMQRKAYTDCMDIQKRPDLAGYQMLSEDEKQWIQDVIKKGCPAFDEKKSDQHAENAKRCIDTGDFESAIDECDQAIIWSESNYAVRIDRAYAYLRQGYYSKAEADYTEIIEHSGKKQYALHAKAYQLRSELYIQKGMTIQAEEDQKNASLAKANLKDILVKDAKYREQYFQAKQLQADKERRRLQLYEMQKQNREEKIERLHEVNAEKTADRDARLQQRCMDAKNLSEMRRKEALRAEEERSIVLQCLAQQQIAADTKKKQDELTKKTQELNAKKKRKDKITQAKKRKKEARATLAVPVAIMPVVEETPAEEKNHKPTLIPPPPSTPILQTTASRGRAWNIIHTEKAQHLVMPVQINKGILSKIITAGYNAEIFGGFVRDTLKQMPINDCDIVTDMAPEELKRLFPNIGFHYDPYRQALKFYYGGMNIDLIYHPAYVISREMHAYTCDYPQNAKYMDGNGRLTTVFAADDKIKLIVKPGEHPEIRLKNDLSLFFGAVKLAAKGYSWDLDYFMQFVRSLDSLNVDSIPDQNMDQIKSQLQKMFLHGNAEKNILKMQELTILTRLFPALATLQVDDYHWMMHEIKQADVKYSAFAQARNAYGLSDSPAPSLKYIYAVMILAIAKSQNNTCMINCHAIKATNRLFARAFPTYSEDFERFIFIAMNNRREYDAKHPRDATHGVLVSKIAPMHGSPIHSKPCSVEAEVKASILAKYHNEMTLSG